MTDSHLYQTPLRLFREGMDTVDIAAHLGCSEATAANLIHRAKEAEHSVDEKRERRRTYQREYQRRARQEIREAMAAR